MPRITGQGSEQWTKRADGWTLRVRWSCASPGGGYRSISKSFHGPTKADCREQAANYKRDINTGMEHRGGAVKIGEYANEWHAQRKSSGRFALGSMANEGRAVAYIADLIGDVSLSDVTPATARKMVSMMESNGVGHETIRKTATTLHSVIKQAAEEQRIPYDMLATWKRPARRYGKRKAMSDTQAERFRREMMAEPMDGYTAATLIAVSAGLRFGECRALKWSNVTFDELDGVVLARIAVESQWQNGEGEKTPKCDSARVVWCDDEVTSWLRRYREKILELAGDDDIGDVLVCQSCKGGRINQRAFYDWWNRWRDSHGFDGYVFHELRHTMATLRIAAGVDIKTVQHDGGWKTASVLLDIYAHTLPDAGIKSALAMSKSCQNALKQEGV